MEHKLTTPPSELKGNQAHARTSRRRSHYHPPIRPAAHVSRCQEREAHRLAEAAAHSHEHWD